MNERAENSYLLDTENVAELTRLIDLDHLVTRQQGGALAGLPPVPEEGNVIDLACGPGGWALDAGFARPDLEVCGVDVSPGMVRYADARARSQCLPNVTFGVMDITRPLYFFDGTFDLVHARFLAAVLKRDAWEPFFHECFRLLRPGGWLQLSECDDAGQTNSPAYNTLCRHLFGLMQRRGYGFPTTGEDLGLSTPLPRLLLEVGFEAQYLRLTRIEFSSAHKEAWAVMKDNARIVFEEVKPLLLSEKVLTEQEYDQLVQQMFIERYQDSFAGTWIVTTWRVHKPLKEHA